MALRKRSREARKGKSNTIGNCILILEIKKY